MMHRRTEVKLEPKEPEKLDFRELKTDLGVALPTLKKKKRNFLFFNLAHFVSPIF